MPYADKEKAKAYAKAYRERNRDTAKEYAKLYNKTNRPSTEESRASKLKHKYGITLEQYNTMFFEQQGCCAICGKHQSAFKTRLSVDHCHTTLRVRKLLCNNCNSALGFVLEDEKILYNMISYLSSNRLNLSEESK